MAAVNQGAPDVSSIKHCKKPVEIVIDNLLLNRTFYLNHSHTSMIVLGFNCSTFEVEFVIRPTVGKPITSGYATWSAFYDVLKNMKLDLGDQVLCNQLALKVVHLITFADTRVMLDHLELLNLFDIQEHLNTVMLSNNNAVITVKSYYDLYMYRCIPKRVMKLPVQDFFIPERTAYKNIEYFRLFNEIPVFCFVTISLDLAKIKDNK